MILLDVPDVFVVLEHLFDPIGALRDMAKSLKPGGCLIHRIDLRDHGMFLNHHPLTYLTINELIYRRMTSESGRPNRILIHRYREWLEESNLDGEIRITRLAGIKNEFKLMVSFNDHFDFDGSITISKCSWI